MYSSKSLIFFASSSTVIAPAATSSSSAITFQLSSLTQFDFNTYLSSYLFKLFGALRNCNLQISKQRSFSFWKNLCLFHSGLYHINKIMEILCPMEKIGGKTICKDFERTTKHLVSNLEKSCTKNIFQRSTCLHFWYILPGLMRSCGW